MYYALGNALSDENIHKDRGLQNSVQINTIQEKYKTKYIVHELTLAKLH